MFLASLQLNLDSVCRGGIVIIHDKQSSRQLHAILDVIADVYEGDYMPTIEPPALRCSNKITPIPDFWEMARAFASLTEQERIARIRAGLEVEWHYATREAFGLTISAVAFLYGISRSTVERRIRNASQIDSVASERIARLVHLALLALEVFEDEAAAIDWIVTPSDALGGESPIALCKTEVGALQARRVLRAIDWGGVV